MKNKNVEELLRQLDSIQNAQDGAEIERIAKTILKLDAKNPVAALALWELIDDEDEAFKKINMLLAALEEARIRIDEDDERLFEVFGQIIMRLAAAYLLAQDYATALTYAEELTSIDPDNYFDSNTYYFCALLGLKDFDRIVQETGEDAPSGVTPAALHARAIALLEKGDTAGAREALIAAFELDIELPFYITGMMPDDVDDAESGLSDEELLQNYFRIIDANFLEEHWFYSDTRTDFFARPLAIVGLLTHRIDEREAEDLTDDEEILNKAIEGAKKLPADDIDDGAIEMLKEIWTL